jgi:hypothetical protein
VLAGSRIQVYAASALGAKARLGSSQGAEKRTPRITVPPASAKCSGHFLGGAASAKPSTAIMAMYAEGTCVAMVSASVTPPSATKRRPLTCA